VCEELWKRRTRPTEKSGEREEEEEQHEKQLEEVTLLKSRPCKPTVVVEVCCHYHELSIAVKVCCFHQDFLLNFFFFSLLFIFLISYCFHFFLVFLPFL